MNKYTVNDAIVDLELVESTGGFVLKITRINCKTGYVTSEGISGKIKNALILPDANSIINLDPPTFSNEGFAI